VGEPRLETSLKAMVCLVEKAPELLDESHEDIIDTFVREDLLMSVERPVTEGEPEDVAEWEQHVSDEVRAKITGIELMAAYIGGRVYQDYEDAAESAKSRIDFLFHVVEQDGNVNDELQTSAPDCSRIRLAAAEGLLRIFTNKHLFQLLGPGQFDILAMMMQDSCEQVRSRFSDKLFLLLNSHKLPLRFMAVLVLGAADPNKQLLEKARGHLETCIRSKRTLLAKLEPNMKQRVLGAHLPEHVLPNLVHLLAHHPDFIEVGADVCSIPSNTVCSAPLPSLVVWCARVLQIALASTFEGGLMRTCMVCWCAPTPLAVLA
jgi:sister-chromatid-cohesion protein PDS5